MAGLKGESRRKLPSVDSALKDGEIGAYVERSGRQVVAEAVREAIGEVRELLAQDRGLSEGDVVKEGDILARLDTDPLELALTQTEAALAQAKASRAQTRVAQAQAGVDLTQVQVALTQAQAALAQAEATRAQAQIALDVAEDNLEDVEDYLERLKKFLP